MVRNKMKCHTVYLSQKSPLQGDLGRALMIERKRFYNGSSVCIGSVMAVSAAALADWI